MDLTNKLIEEMVSYNRGDAKRIQHFIKVHSFAKLIGETEDLSPAELFVLETAAVVHDIGIKPSEAKYGRYEDGISKEGVQRAYEKILVTETGKRICREMFGIEG